MRLNFWTSKPVRYISLLLLIVWMCFIFVMSGDPADVSDDKSDGFISAILSAVYPDFEDLKNDDRQYVVSIFSPPVRKAAHFSEYAVLGALAFVFFNTFSLKSRRFYISFPFLLGFLYSVSDEIHQLFVPGRAGMVTDVYIDTAGVLFGVIFLRLIILRGDRLGR